MQARPAKGARARRATPRGTSTAPGARLRSRAHASPTRPPQGGGRGALRPLLKTACPSPGGEFPCDNPRECPPHLSIPAATTGGWTAGPMGTASPSRCARGCRRAGAGTTRRRVRRRGRSAALCPVSRRFPGPRMAPRTVSAPRTWSLRPRWPKTGCRPVSRRASAGQGTWGQASSAVPRQRSARASPARSRAFARGATPSCLARRGRFHRRGAIGLGTAPAASTRSGIPPATSHE